MSGEKFNEKGFIPSRVLYVGVDVGKFKHCARATTSCRERRTKALFFGQRRRSFERLVREIGRWCKRFDCSVIEVGLEPTGNYWKPLFNYLVGLGFTVKLVPPLYVRCEKNKHDNSPLKCDEKDALLIAHLVRENQVINLSCLPARMEEVKSLVKQLASMDKMIVRLANQLESYVTVHFPELSGIFKSLNSPTVRALLGRYPFPSMMVEAGLEEVQKLLWTASRGRVKFEKLERLMNAARMTVGLGNDTDAERMSLEFILKYLNLLNEDLARLKAAISKALKRVSIYPILDSVPGVGDMTAAAIIAALGDLKNYSNYRQVLKKAGLNLYHISSGKRSGRKRISKRGFGFLRKMLYMAAISHTRKGSYFYDKYQGMVDRGVKPNEALVAIMRKLLKIAYALVRDGRMFEHDYRCNRGTNRDEKPLLRACAA